jgi:putative ABC transport system permease protein
MIRIDWRRLSGLQHAWCSDLHGDVRFAARQLTRSPGFTFAVLATLALAIGANTAAFTLFRAVLLTRLPYDAPDRLVHLWEGNPRSPQGRAAASWPDFLDWRSQSHAFAGLEGYDPSNLAAAASDGGRMLQGGRVTPGFLDLLGATPQLGRGFLPEDEVPGGAGVVIVSHGYWLSRFGGIPSVLDSSMTMNGRRYRVIGVLPGAFHFAPLGEASVWLPLDPADPSRQQRFNHGLRVVGRLRDGVTPVAAQASLNTLMARLAQAYPETNKGRTALVVPLADELTGSARPLLVGLLLAMSLVLAIAGANIAGLLLARALAREHEMLVRSALGATRGRLVRQLLVESLLLAGLGGGLGLTLAHVSVQFATAALPDGLRSQLPSLRDVPLDAAVFGYCAAVTLITGIGFGLGPILHVLRVAPRAGLSTARGGSAARSLLRIRDGLIVAEIALTMALLSGTALVGRSLTALFRLELGFSPEEVTTVRVGLSGPRYANSSGAQQRFFERLLADVRAIPGVRAAGAVSSLPLEGGRTLTFRVEGRPEPRPSAGVEVVGRGVAGDYFHALAVPLLAGRLLTAQDDSTRPLYLLIDESTARRAFPDGNAVGQRLRLEAFPDSPWEIAGVVGDVRTGPLDQPFRPTIYTSHLQSAENRMSLVVRSAVEPGEVVSRIRKAVSSLDPNAVVYGARTLGDQVSDSGAVVLRRLSLLLLGAGAGVALVLSVMGLYGVVAFTVARRSRELGIRAALGAGPGALLRLVMRQGLALNFLGTGIGVGLGLALAATVRTLLFGVSPTDPMTYVATAALLTGATLTASWLPARKATRVDPATVLRRE